MQSIAALAFLALFSAACGGRIDPKLEPESDEKFMKKDYPDDRRPSAETSKLSSDKFSHPYPEVQDDSHYDNDYVGDKNHDSGHWEVQMAYDTARSRLAKEKLDLKEAMAKELEEKKQLDEVKAKEQAELDKAAAAKSHADMKKGESQKADKDLDDASSELASATAAVEKEMAELEECKKELAAAKERLQLVLSNKEGLEKKQAEASEAEKAAAEKAAAEKASNAEIEKTADEEEKEHKDAVSAVNTKTEDVKKAEDDLEKKSEALRKFRKADPDGGVYEKAGALSATFSFSLFGLIVALLHL